MQCIHTVSSVAGGTGCAWVEAARDVGVNTCPGQAHSTSPFRYPLLMMCSTRLANSSGRPLGWRHRPPPPHHKEASVVPPIGAQALIEAKTICGATGKRGCERESARKRAQESVREGREEHRHREPRGACRRHSRDAGDFGNLPRREGHGTLAERAAMMSSLRPASMGVSNVPCAARTGERVNRQRIATVNVTSHTPARAPPRAMHRYCETRHWAVCASLFVCAWCGARRGGEAAAKGGVCVCVGGGGGVKRWGGGWAGGGGGGGGGGMNVRARWCRCGCRSLRDRGQWAGSSPQSPPLTPLRARQGNRSP